MRWSVASALLILAACDTIPENVALRGPLNAVAAPALSDAQRAELLQMLSTDEEAYPFEGPRVDDVVLEYGEASLPILNAAAAGRPSVTRDRALRALAYLGGEEAVAILRREYRRKPEMPTEMMLCGALGSTGSAEDRLFLIRVVDSAEGREYGDDWPPVVDAVFALGALRALEARPSLDSLAQSPSIAGSAAQEVLRWFDEGPWATPGPRAGDEEDRVILALFANGIAGVGKGARFYDSGRQRLWTLRDKQWICESVKDPPAEVPDIGFNVRVSSDARRARVAVGIVRGPLNGIGHDYVLRKSEEGWRITGIYFTWIS